MKYLIGFALFMTALLFTLLVSGYAVDRFNITFAAEKTEPKIPVQSNEEFCIDYIQPRDPESPWYRDPDISAIKDERIVQLWEDIMITYRRNYPTGATVESIYCSKEYMAEPNTPENQEILIDALSLALSTDPVDWNYVRTVLALMQKGMSTDSRIAQLADQLFTTPRNIKMSNNYGNSVRAMYHILKQQKTKETAELLYKACSREYWGDDPMHTPSLSKERSEESIIMVRKFALIYLSEYMPPELSIPLLEQLASAYPDTYVPPDIVVQPADQFRSERRENIDFSRADIDAALDKAYKMLAAEESEK